MSRIIKGKVFVLGDDIDTDQIIPAKYLVYSLEDMEERKKYGEYVLSGVPPEKSGLPNGNISLVPPGKFISQYNIIVAGKNFGCGSSREHAPAALEIADVKCIVAPSYARIFYRNAIDGGFLIPIETNESLIEYFDTNDEAEINLNQNQITNVKTNQRYSIKSLGQVEAIIEAGGIFAYARNSGILRRD